ncbi:MAG: glycosyltransferase family 39 protein, partial [Candidatus Omnitrophota bacterium]
MSRRALNLCLGAVFVLAAFLHFRNLGGVVYLNEDEARAFTLMTSGPLIWAMGSPVYAFFGRTQAAVFYLAAFLGLCSSWFFYRWCRLWFDGRTALAATLVYAIFPLRINYARTLFPPVFIEFYFMAALWSASVGLLKHSQRRMALSGIFCAAMLFVHVACYSMVFALFCAAVVYGYVERRQIGAAHLWRLFSAMAVGLLGGFLFLEIGFIIVGRGYEYISKSVIMNDYTHLYARYAQTTRRFVPEFLDQWRRLPLWFVIFPSTVAAVILFFMHTFRQKSSRLYFICVLYGVGLGLFLLMAITGVHTIYERHFVWLSSLCAVAVAATLMRLWAAARRPAKKGLVAFAAVLWPRCCGRVTR